MHMVVAEFGHHRSRAKLNPFIAATEGAMRFGLMLPSQATGSRRQVAAQTIFHDQRYPSHILLPLIPR